MKKPLLFLLLILPLYFTSSLYYLDKSYFLSPVEYKTGVIPLRSDGRGDGFFAAKRNGHRFHEGIDLFAPLNTPIFASRSGRVVEAGYAKGYGNCIIISHPNNITTIYAHLFRIYVRPGQFIRQGRIIGRTGKSGNANYHNIQPHLHFEVRSTGIPQDPMEYLQ